MAWIWELKNWHDFQYDSAILEEYERQYLHLSGALAGASLHISEYDRDDMIIDLMCNEALKTSEIEGEYLNRESLRSSLRRRMGFGKDRQRPKPQEEGIAEMMIDLYKHYNEKITHDSLSNWNGQLTSSRWDLTSVGCYRNHSDPMQIVSGSISRPHIHYEAPPSSRIMDEMEDFLLWFNKTSLEKKLPALTRAGIAHLYFVCIHPFEDGNGRISRALSIKSLSQNIGQSTLLALSEVIQQNKKEYYAALATTNQSNDISKWLLYFAKTILQAQEYTQKIVNYLISKNKFYEKYRSLLNPRQEKVITRIFREGMNGFEGGLSAKNYVIIAKTSSSTATRDLQELVMLEVLKQKGSGKGTRYYLNLNSSD